MTVELTLLLIGSYLLGGVPFGVLVARAHGIDIMAIGSGNTGATNVIRALGKGPGLFVFFLDLAKGLGPTLAARALFPGRQELWFLAGAMAVIGHSLSPFLKFKGGKGISTALGMALGSSPIVALISFVVFSILLAAVGYMSFASMVAVALTIPLTLVFRDSPWVTAGFALLALFVIYRHRSNIERLRKGTEPKFKLNKTIDESPAPAKERPNSETEFKDAP
jgi:glycerol-3-phosphate acyltransferase PlsY